MIINKYVKENDVWVKELAKPEEWDEDTKYESHYVAFAIPGLTFSASYLLRCPEIGNYYSDLFKNSIMLAAAQ